MMMVLREIICYLQTKQYCKSYVQSTTAQIERGLCGDAEGILLQEAAAANYYYFDLISWICDPLKEKEIILRNKNREVYSM